MDEDLKRYSSAAGWNPRDPYRKLRENARREYKSKPQPGQSMLEIRPASHWIIKPSAQKPRPELYGPIWREGDVCLMFGPKGIGKSLFAVQLAEDIATGTRSLTDLSEPRAVATGLHPPSRHVSEPRAVATGLHAPTELLSVPGTIVTGEFNSTKRQPSSQKSKIKSQRSKVLLIDFEHTTAQFTERYTYPSPIPGKLPCRTRFHFQRASIGEIGPIPACFKGRIHDYLQHSISAAIRDSEAEVVILDSINYLFRGSITATTMTNVLKSLKLYAHTYGVSILATVGTPTSLSARKTTGTRTSMSASAKSANQRISTAHQSTNPLTRYAHELALATLADSTFILAPSTYGPQYRYTKLLTTRTQVPENLAPTSPDVLTYQLAPNSPSYKGGVSAASDDGVVLSGFGALSGRGGSLFTYLGPSNEQDHLRNYAAELEATQIAQERQIKRLARRSSTAALVDGILDGSYGRYLKGE